MIDRDQFHATPNVMYASIAEDCVDSDGIFLIKNLSPFGVSRSKEGL